MKRKPVLLITAFFLSLILSACGGASTSTDSGAPRPAGVAMDSSENEYAVAETMAAPVGEMAAVQAASESGQITDSATISPELPAARKLIRTVRLSVETNAFDSFLNDLNQQVAQLDGYVEQSDISGNSMHQNRPAPRYASLTIRVPADKLDQLILQVEKQGNVTNRSENTQDVTLRYTDLESRKKSLTVEQDRLWELLEKADTLESVIALEERLSEIRYQLESLESQLRLYDNQVDYSTVNLDIQEIVQDSDFTPTEPEGFGARVQKGLSKNLASLAEGAVSFAVAVITLSPFWLPLLVIALSLLFVIRRAAKQKEDSSPKEKPEEKS